MKNLDNNYFGKFQEIFWEVQELLPTAILRIIFKKFKKKISRIEIVKIYGEIVENFEKIREEFRKIFKMWKKFEEILEQLFSKNLGTFQRNVSI